MRGRCRQASVPVGSSAQGVLGVDSMNTLPSEIQSSCFQVVTAIDVTRCEQAGTLWFNDWLPLLSYLFFVFPFFIMVSLVLGWNESGAFGGGGGVIPLVDYRRVHGPQVNIARDTIGWAIP